MKRFLSATLFFAVTGFSILAQACPVCFSAKGGTLNAFRFSTVFLTLLPIFAGYFFIRWYIRRAKELDSL